MDFQTPEELLGLKKRFPIKPGLIAFFVVALIVVVTAVTMVYRIEPDEQGVVLRLGKYMRTDGPGLHFRLPWGLDTVEPIKVKKVHTEEFGFRTVQPGIRSRYSNQQYNEESLMLTGDLNALDVSWIVQYRVKDPVQLLYKIRKPRAAIRDISEVVMRQLVGDYSVDEVLSTKRTEINLLAEEKIQEILDFYECGIQVETVKLQDVTPPTKVQPAFNAVNEAKQEKERMINQAQQKYNEIIPKARGTAEKTVLEAEAYAINRINRAKGDVHRFSALYQEYSEAPEITKQRLYLETLEDIMAQPKEKFIVDPSQTGILPLLNLKDD